MSCTAPREAKQGGPALLSGSEFRSFRLDRPPTNHRDEGRPRSRLRKQCATGRSLKKGGRATWRLPRPPSQSARDAPCFAPAPIPARRRPDCRAGLRPRHPRLGPCPRPRHRSRPLAHRLALRIPARRARHPRRRPPSRPGASSPIPRSRPSSAASRSCSSAPRSPDSASSPPSPRPPRSSSPPSWPAPSAVA